MPRKPIELTARSRSRLCPRPEGLLRQTSLVKLRLFFVGAENLNTRALEIVSFSV